MYVVLCVVVPNVPLLTLLSSLRHARPHITSSLPVTQDHFRTCVKPCFTDVYRDRGEAVGVAEFETMEDMRTAIRRLDDTEFKNPFEKTYIRITEVRGRVFGALVVLVIVCTRQASALLLFGVGNCSLLAAWWLIHTHRVLRTSFATEADTMLSPFLPPRRAACAGTGQRRVWRRPRRWWLRRRLRRGWIWRRRRLRGWWAGRRGWVRPRRPLPRRGPGPRLREAALTQPQSITEPQQEPQQESQQEPSRPCTPQRQQEQEPQQVSQQVGFGGRCLRGTRVVGQGG